MDSPWTWTIWVTPGNFTLGASLGNEASSGVEGLRGATSSSPRWSSSWYSSQALLGEESTLATFEIPTYPKTLQTFNNIAFYACGLVSDRTFYRWRVLVRIAILLQVIHGASDLHRGYDMLLRSRAGNRNAAGYSGSITAGGEGSDSPSGETNTLDDNPKRINAGVSEQEKITDEAGPDGKAKCPKRIFLSGVLRIILSFLIFCTALAEDVMTTTLTVMTFTFLMSPHKSMHVGMLDFLYFAHLAHALLIDGFPMVIFLGLYMVYRFFVGYNVALYSPIEPGKVHCAPGVPILKAAIACYCLCSFNFFIYLLFGREMASNPSDFFLRFFAPNLVQDSNPESPNPSASL